MKSKAAVLTGKVVTRTKPFTEEQNRVLEQFYAKVKEKRMSIKDRTPKWIGTSERDLAAENEMKNRSAAYDGLLEALRRIELAVEDAPKYGFSPRQEVLSIAKDAIAKARRPGT
jgi:hypothetical protein